jgi:hypothetical protein
MVDICEDDHMPLCPLNPQFAFLGLVADGGMCNRHLLDLGYLYRVYFDSYLRRRCLPGASSGALQPSMSMSRSSSSAARSCRGLFAFLTG